jgi:hypothetical protein
MGLQQIPSKGGIPSGNTAARPGSPVIGDTYYDGTLGFLMIFDGTNFIPCSAPASQPSLTVTDVGTNVAYGTVQASVAFTEGTTGGKAAGFTATQSAQSVTQSSSPIVLTITDNPGSYSFGGTTFNAFGTSPAATTVSQTLTSLSQAPTIGTATAGDSQAQLTFTAPVNNGGKSITNYKWSTNGSTYTALSPADTTSPLTIPGLTNGVQVTISLKAVTANGDSLASGVSNAITPAPWDGAVDYLVVAGGGGGNCNPSNNAAGAGGAGGYRTSIGGTSLTLSAGIAYDVVVGSGGAGSTTGTSIAGKGGNSRFATIYSTGGGGGAYEGLAGATGGSGGGEASGTTNPGAGNEGGYSPVEGYAGGQASGDGGSGGGGAGGLGGNATNSGTNGAGGIGSNSASAWASITSSGANSGYYAGGGTGGGYQAASTTAGGLGGGGEGRSRNGAGGAGVANTGGGGGAQGGTGGPGTGGNGGSGIVIIKYPNTVIATFSGGLTQTTYEDGGFNYSKITAGTGTVTF